MKLRSITHKRDFFIESRYLFFKMQSFYERLSLFSNVSNEAKLKYLKILEKFLLND